ncbi:MAG: STAS domain-containing protein [Cyanobacteriota bacterium]|nr:STAS domain-containing protein [Cyanobacteriota bacterium]
MSDLTFVQEATTPQGQKLAVLSLRGNLNITTTAEVRRKLYEIIQRGYPNLLLEVKGVGMVDSSGLGVLVSALHRCRIQGGSIGLCQLPESLRMLLELTSMHKALPHFASVEEGIRQFPSSTLFEG